MTHKFNKNFHVENMFLLVISCLPSFSICLWPYNDNIINTNCSITSLFTEITDSCGFHQGVPENAIIDTMRIIWKNIPESSSVFVLYDQFQFWDGTTKINNNINLNNNRIYHLRNCYVSGYGAVFFEDKFINSTLPYESLRAIYKPLSGKVIAHRNLVINTGHYASMNFGHFLQDTISPLIQFPKEILKQATVFTCNSHKYLMDTYLPLFEFKEAITMTGNEWLYAKELYINLNPRCHVAHLGPCWHKLTLLIRKKFNLTNAKPYRYVLSQRNHNGNRTARYIYNLNDIFNSVKRVYPDINFEIFLLDNKPLNETIKVWSTTKILYTVCGSNCFNCIFFHPTTICIIVFDELFDNSALAVVAANFHKVILYQEPSIKHIYSYNILNISRALSAFKIAIHLDKYGVWPNETYGKFFI